MERLRVWAWLLGSVAIVLVGAWALTRFVLDLEQVSQLAGIGSLAAGVAAVVVAIWAVRVASGEAAGDVIVQDGARAKRSVIGKKGRSGRRGGGDRISQRKVRAEQGDVIGKQDD